MRSKLPIISRASGTLILTVSLLSFSTSARAQSACDLNRDGTINVVDLQLAIDMQLNLLPCTADINGVGVCNDLVRQRVLSAALGGACVVTLSWTASSSSSVTGYNIYQASAPTGPYTKINSSPIVGTTYSDGSIKSGQTYYYVVTAVNTSNNESAYSNQAAAIVPSP